MVSCIITVVGFGCCVQKKRRLREAARSFNQTPLVMRQIRTEYGEYSFGMTMSRLKQNIRNASKNDVTHPISELYILYDEQGSESIQVEIN